MIEIIPAIMPKDFADLKAKVGAVYKHVKTVQVDVMDGSMTHSINWPFSGDGLNELQKITTGEMELPYWKEVNYEVDIMMENPEDSLAEWVNAGFRRIIVHFENTKKLAPIIHEWKGAVEVGVAVGVDTPNDEVYRYVDEGIDFVQFMGIFQIGFQGNPFDSRVIEKIQKAREAYPNLIISVDGSVNLETAPLLIAAGVNRLVVGSALFKKQESNQRSAIFDTGEDINVSDVFDENEGVIRSLKTFIKLAQ